MVTPPGGLRQVPGGRVARPGNGTVQAGTYVSSMAGMVSVRKLSSGRWLVSCLVCGKLADLRAFWPAAHMARLHESIHSDE